MTRTKLTDEEKKKIDNLQSEYSQKIYSLGSLYSKIAIMNMQLVKLHDLVKEAEGEIQVMNTNEETMFAELSKKYGEDSIINIKDGTIQML